ncbi:MULTISPECIES: glycoside hydrolase family 25 protein [Streptomyces]|uniref:glycoside hydrolase family 25 protein n=1 Tax=Streptomyces TaxID=1883 RepID=UPI00163C501C|nr:MULTISPECIES: glycoside hydrolase family 25 protein [Streptomyces]MBC2874167.1 glycoside hydrolase family 25 protein [Streptomyces sp. TYQ1024]UBI40215.1 glycoside hydrolase family 25 protein [Streptomyces mobaraensis]UKW32793.1 glycoside hydrolase family 25 protein [Streptomyces sp. TYQ1024]
MIHGVDVSSYQSENYSVAGQDFAFVKVTEGMSYTNPKWVAQRDRARAAGLVVGYYHYVTPGSMSAQADRFLGKIALRAGDVLALDWEESGVSCADKDRWLARVAARAPGHRVVLYCNRDFWFHRDTTSRAGDGLWIADPDHAAGRPGVQFPWTFHQYGTSGGIDRNVARFADRAALRSWARREEEAAD